MDSAAPGWLVNEIGFKQDSLSLPRSGTLATSWASCNTSRTHRAVRPAHVGQADAREGSCASSWPPRGRSLRATVLCEGAVRHVSCSVGEPRCRCPARVMEVRAAVELEVNDRRDDRLDGRRQLPGFAVSCSLQSQRLTRGRCSWSKPATYDCFIHNISPA